MKFAIVQEAHGQSDVLKALLTGRGYEVTVFANGEACRAALENRAFGFFVVDVGAPEIGGMQLLGHIRERFGWAAAIICISAHDSEEAAVDSLRLGADCFMAMPIRFMEFMARVEVLHRRLHLEFPPAVCVGDIELDEKAMRVVLRGEETFLTRREFDLAALLLSHVGRVFSRQELLQGIWLHATPVDTRTVDTHISKLRKKLRLDGGAGLVLSAVYGRGYRLDPVRGA